MSKPATKSQSSTKRPYKTSDKSIQASRTNGAKSKGGKTPESRKAGALNALKDGCMAETEVLPGESISEYLALIDRWRRMLLAAGEIEEGYAKEAARCWWFLRRLRRADTAIIHLQMIEAERADKARRDQEVAALGKQLFTSPAAAVAQLRQTSTGCLYLKSKWEIIANELAAETAIWPFDRDLAIRLSGERPCDIFISKTVFEWTNLYLGSVVYSPQGVPSENAPNLLLNSRPEEMPEDEFVARLRGNIKRIPERSRALEDLKTKITAAITELKSEADRLVAAEELARELRVVGATSDDGLAGGRRYRRIQTLQKQMDHAIAMVETLRGKRLAGVYRLIDDDEESPDPGPTGPAPGPDLGGAETSVKNELECSCSTEKQGATAQEVESRNEGEGEPELKQVPEGDPNPRPEPAAEPAVPSLGLCPLPRGPRGLWRPVETPPEANATDSSPAAESPPGAVQGDSRAVAVPATIAEEPAGTSDPAPDSLKLEKLSGVAVAESSTPRSEGPPSCAGAMAPLTPPLPPDEPLPAPNPVPPPAANPGGSFGWRPAPHPQRLGDPRTWRGGPIPPHKSPLPQRRPGPPTAPGPGNDFNPRDG